MKVRPGRITTLASCRYPTRDWRSCFLQHFNLDQRESIHFRRVSFSCGRRRTIDSVSNSMPRKVRHVAGPSCLSTASKDGAYEHKDEQVVIAFITVGSPESDEIV